MVKKVKTGSPVSARPVSSRRIPDKKLVTWDSEHKDKLKRNLDLLMKTLVIEQGKAVAHEIFRFHAILYVLNSIIDLHEIRNGRSKRKMMNEACFRLRTLNRQDASTFRRILASKVRRHLSLPAQRYRIVLPLNIDRRSLNGRRWLSVLGLRLKKRTWSYVRKHLAVNDWLRASKLRLGMDERSFYGPFTPLEVVVTGGGTQEAFDEAYGAYELLRSALNLNDAFYTYSRQFGRSEPLGKVRPAHTYGVFREDGTFIDFYVLENPPTDYKQPPISADLMRATDRLLRDLNRHKDSKGTMRSIEEATRKYGQALDTTDWREAFLSFWQILELLTFRQSDETYSTKKVCGRVSVLLQGNRLMADVLETCHDTRNALVHRGRFSDDGLSEVGMLKAIAEQCINAVYNLRGVCPDWDSLLAYYQNAGVPQRDLATKSKVIRSIQRMKAANVKSRRRAVGSASA